MTAETDALRLVPLEPTEAMLDAMFSAYCASYGSYREAYRAALAAAPAVQPAAAVALSASDRACYDYPGVDQVKERAAFVAGAEYAALAHPPAQGSESGGEDAVRRYLRLTTRPDSWVLTERSGSVDEAYRITNGDLRAALSQPGPASEGDGE